MAYRQDFVTSARRHWKAADTLHGEAGAGLQPGCKAVAGYLYGLSGELAVKEIMRDSGIAPLPPENRRDDPYYAHFPHLKTQLKDSISGRRAGELLKIAESQSLFQNWDTDMRYAPTADIQDRWVTAWKASATELIAQMDSA